MATPKIYRDKHIQNLDGVRIFWARFLRFLLTIFLLLFQPEIYSSESCLFVGFRLWFKADFHGPEITSYVFFSSSSSCSIFINNASRIDLNLILRT